MCVLIICVEIKVKCSHSHTWLDAFMVSQKDTFHLSLTDDGSCATGVQRGLVGDIISRFERKGFKLIGLKMMQCTKEIAEEHYKDLKEKPFFPALVEYILSGPVVCMVWEGDGVVKSARKLIGATNPLEAEPGTIRGDFAIQVGRNVVHGSDSPENGERETAIWFGNEGLVSWESTLTPWLIE